MYCICYMYSTYVIKHYATRQKDAVSTPPIIDKRYTHLQVVIKLLAYKGHQFFKVNLATSTILKLFLSVKTQGFFSILQVWNQSRLVWKIVFHGWQKKKLGPRFVTRSIYNVEDPVQLPLCFFNVRSLRKRRPGRVVCEKHKIYVPGSKLLILGMVIPPIIGNPHHSGYIHPSYWDDDHPRLYYETMRV